MLEMPTQANAEDEKLVRILFEAVGKVKLRVERGGSGLQSV